jgi:hypothetical protein
LSVHAASLFLSYHPCVRAVSAPRLSCVRVGRSWLPALIRIPVASPTLSWTSHLPHHPLPLVRSKAVRSYSVASASHPVPTGPAACRDVDPPPHLAMRLCQALSHAWEAHIQRSNHIHSSTYVRIGLPAFNHGPLCESPMIAVSCRQRLVPRPSVEVLGP